MTAVLEIQGRGRTAFCRPVQSFSQVARQAGMKDEDGLRFAVPSRPWLLAVPPPGPTGAPDGCEHWEYWPCIISAKAPCFAYSRENNTSIPGEGNSIIKITKYFKYFFKHTRNAGAFYNFLSCQRQLCT